jgi:Uncharacterised nucleotidyltransferase
LGSTEAFDSQELLRAGTALAIDSAAVELTEQLRDRGIRAIVLRGPAIARRLYADRPRAYEDVDLLVARVDADAVEAVVREAGFELTSRDVHATPWIRRSDGMNVDVHVTLIGIHAPPDVAWQELAHHAEPLPLAGGAADVLAPPALAMAIALHAAQHGLEGGKSLEDLARALDQLPAPDWRAAAGLAARLEATEAFAAGLRLLPAGAALADALDLSTAQSRETALRARSAPPTALGFWRLSETPGVGEKVRLLGRELVPSAPFMRAMYPLARRGRLGLAASYVLRPLALARQAGPGFLAWRRAKARAQRP